MTEAVVVRSALALYLVAAVVAAGLIWKNAAAPDALKNAGIAVATTLPLLVAVLPYLSRERTSAVFDFVLLFDSQEKSIVAGQSWNPYAAAYLHMFTNLGTVPDALKAETLDDAMNQQGLDIIEKGIVEAVTSVFGKWWNMESLEHPGPIGEGKRYRPLPTDGETVVSIEQLRTAFAYNRLIAQPGVLVVPTLTLPPGTRIAASKEDHSRSITVQNPFMQTIISMRPYVGSVAQHGVWGVLEPDATNLNRYYTISFEVSVSHSGRVGTPHLQVKPSGGLRHGQSNACRSRSANR
jgi:hypothetical protein